MKMIRTRSNSKLKQINNMPKSKSIISHSDKWSYCYDTNPFCHLLSCRYPPPPPPPPSSPLILTGAACLRIHLHSIAIPCNEETVSLATDMAGPSFRHISSHRHLLVATHSTLPPTYLSHLFLHSKEKNKLVSTFLW